MLRNPDGFRWMLTLMLTLNGLLRPWVELVVPAESAVRFRNPTRRRLSLAVDVTFWFRLFRLLWPFVTMTLISVFGTLRLQMLCVECHWQTGETRVGLIFAVCCHVRCRRFFSFGRFGLRLRNVQ